MSEPHQCIEHGRGSDHIHNLLGVAAMARDIVSVKTCRKCGTSFSGLECKVCKKRRAAEDYAKNRDRIRVRGAAYYAAHREKFLALNAEWKAVHPERMKELQRRWHKDNDDRMRAAMRAWHAANREEQNAKKRAWDASNKELKAQRSAAYRAKSKEKIAALNAAYRIANPVKRRIQEQNRLARKRNNGGKLSHGLVEKLFTLQYGKCACGCGKALGKNYHLDHRVPLARGGAHTDANMQLLTQSCNSQKGAKDPIAFMQERGFLI